MFPLFNEYNHKKRMNQQDLYTFEDFSSKIYNGANPDEQKQAEKSLLGNNFAVLRLLLVVFCFSYSYSFHSVSISTIPTTATSK